MMDEIAEFRKTIGDKAHLEEEVDLENPEPTLPKLRRNVGTDDAKIQRYERVIDQLKKMVDGQRR